MSSTVGYGIEVEGEAFGAPVVHGEFDMEVDERYPSLTVVRSRAEYGDESRIFVFVAASVTEAGSDHGTAARLQTGMPDEDPFEDFVNESGVTVIDSSAWYLVDYYVYS